jgi:hypothetical protein
MDKPSKYPSAMDTAATARVTNAATPIESLLTRDDVALLQRLDPTVAGNTHARRDLIALLSEPETLAALVKYQSYFEAGGVSVQPTIEAAPQVRELVALRDRLERSVAVVNQHIAHVGTPSVSTIYKLHKAIVGTVNNSPVRLAFASFEARWNKLYERKRRASDAKKSDATKPSADAPKPKPNPT